MRRIILSSVVVVIVSGCASQPEWSEWKSHSSHFASGEHMVFSIKNRFGAGRRAEVSREDMKEAGQDKWFGHHIIQEGQDLAPKE